MTWCGEEVALPWVWWVAVDAVAVVVAAAVRRSWERQRWWERNVVVVPVLPVKAQLR